MLKRFEQINVIPFIDIMLVLLAIVLTTASFISQGLLEIKLPQSQAAQVSGARQQALEIAINRKGGYLLDGKPVSAGFLLQKIGKLSAADQVQLRVDKQAHFAAFVKVIDALKRQKLTHISLLTVKE